MRCPRCQHENRPQAKFCEECASPFNGASPTAPSYADLKTEVERLKPVLTGALEQQKATAEILQTRTHELAEAHEQQTATSEILRVISSSTRDIQPTLDAIAASAASLCEAAEAAVYRFDGDLIHVVAYHGGDLNGLEVLKRMFPRPPGRGTIVGRAILTGTVVQADVARDPEHEFQEIAGFFRAVLAVPMLRDGVVIGAIDVNRREDRPFSAKQIALLETFADQAVIAIENVRLFNETKEALEQQTATAEILRVIASSPTDLQPVMEAVAENAARVCEATDSAILRLEGEHLRLVARHGSLRLSMTMGDTVPVGRDTLVGQAVRDRRTIHVEDIKAAETEFPGTASRMRETGLTSGQR